jgi:uncharacterized membrane protein
VNALSALIGLLYPFVVFVGLRWVSARTIAVTLGMVLLGRLAIRLRRRRWSDLSPMLGSAAFLMGLVALAAFFDDGRYFTLVPVVVNVGLFLVFGRSLLRGPSMVEVLARLQYSRVPVEHLPYCYRVTVVWTAFFALNALIILWLAATASLQVWALYTGLIAYLLAGALLVSERTYRAWRFRRYGDGPADALLRRIFPPIVGR